MPKSKSQTTKQRAKRSQGNVHNAQRALTTCINELECRVIQDLTNEDLARITSALSTAAGIWLKLYEQQKIDERQARYAQSRR